MSPGGRWEVNGLLPLGILLPPPKTGSPTCFLERPELRTAPLNLAIYPQHLPPSPTRGGSHNANQSKHAVGNQVIHFHVGWQVLANLQSQSLNQRKHFNKKVLPFLDLLSAWNLGTDGVAIKTSSTLAWPLPGQRINCGDPFLGAQATPHTWRGADRSVLPSPPSPFGAPALS